MIKSFRIKNLRSIRDSKDIELAKITILVGKNSAGKSTLLRVLPLLRQSAERTTKGPLLWYGRFVDFGSFKNAVNSDNPGDGITIEFNISMDGKVGRNRKLGRLDFFESIEGSSFYTAIEDIQIRLTVGLGANDDTGKARSISLNLGSDEVSVFFKQNENASSADASVVLNGRLITPRGSRRWSSRPGKVLPIPVLLKEETFLADGKRHTFYSRDVRPYSEELAEEASKLILDTKFSGKSIELLDTLLYAKGEDFYTQLKDLGKSIPQINDHLPEYTHDSPYITTLRELTLLSNISGILSKIDDEIAKFSNNIKYIEPLRATAERYYRLQDLAVDEIDSRGENTAMFLNSLSFSETRHLQNWMKTNLGSYAFVKPGSGHVQVHIMDGEGHDKNIADLGFGYSQLLPIILQIWRSTSTFSYVLGQEAVRPVIAIEQPELHLHPQFQAQIADVLAAVVSDQSNSSAIILETHSEHLINRMGELISRGRISSKDVQVLVVDQMDSANSTVTKISFDTSGYLDSSWPSGFFVPEF